MKTRFGHHIVSEHKRSYPTYPPARPAKYSRGGMKTPVNISAYVTFTSVPILPIRLRGRQSTAEEE